MRRPGCRVKARGRLFRALLAEEAKHQGHHHDADAGEAAISLQFVPNPPIDGMRIIEMVHKHKHIKLAGQDKLRIETRSPDLAVRVSTVKETLRALGAPARQAAAAAR